MFTLLDNIYSSGWLIFVILFFFFKALLLGNACSVELLSISFDSEARYASYRGPQVPTCDQCVYIHTFRKRESFLTKVIGGLASIQHQQMHFVAVVTEPLGGYLFVM